MTGLGLGFRTDLMIHTLQGGTVQRRDGYRVVRLPANPKFRWANFLLLDQAPEPGSLAGWLTLFGTEFPAAEYVALGVAEPDAPPDRYSADELAATGLHAEWGAVLAARALRRPRHANAAAVCRPLATEDDWRAAVELTMANNVTGSNDGDGDGGGTREDPGEYRILAGCKRAGLRRAQEAGHGAWFGAFLDGRLVSALGLFTDGGGVARFQSVDTHPDFRGRGLAGTLVFAAAEQLLRRTDVHTLVIVADPAYHAVQLYRGLGFTDVERQLKLERRPGAATDQPG